MAERHELAIERTCAVGQVVDLERPVAALIAAVRAPTVTPDDACALLLPSASILLGALLRGLRLVQALHAFGLLLREVHLATGVAGRHVRAAAGVSAPA
jgi:hypothetical protein